MLEEELRRRYTYCPDTGVVLNRKGHEMRRIFCMGVYLKVYRLAWFLHYGTFPKKCIDHIDGNPENNKIANLRDVDHATNNRNRSLRVDNSLGLTGVHWDANASKWVCQVYAGSVRKFKRFYTLLDAASYRLTHIAGEYHENHGRVSNASNL